MVSKKVTKGTKRRSDVLKSAENLSTKEGMKTVKNVVPDQESSMPQLKEEDISLVPVIEGKHQSWSDELKDQFANLQEFFHLHPEGAEEQISNHVQTSRKKKGNSTLDKLNMIRRIEKAIEEDVREISTYEFFGFNDPLAPSSCKQVSCSISLVGFHNDKMLKKEALITGPLPCNAKKIDHNKNVVYHPVAKCLADSATDGYLVAEVHVDYIPSSNQSKGTRGASGRSRTSVSHDVPMGKRTFYGSRKIFERTNLSDCLGIKFCNSAIHMSADTQMNSNWELNHSSVSTLAVKLEADSKCVRLPSLAFELTDQHCEQDWLKITQRMEWRKERKQVDEEDKCQRYIIHTEPTPSGSNSSISSVFNTSDSSKENVGNEKPSVIQNQEKMEIDEEFETEILLAKMIRNRCPFCLKDQEDSEDLKAHLSSRYPFDFKLVDNVIEVTSLNSSSRLRPGSSLSSSIREDSELTRTRIDDKFGILPNELVPFAMPIVTPNPYSTYSQDCVLVETNSDWKEVANMREMKEFIDNTKEETAFMSWVNSHSLKNTRPVQGQNQKADFIKFLADDLATKKPLPWETGCPLLAAMTHSLLKSNAISAKVFNEVVNYIFSRKQ